MTRTRFEPEQVREIAELVLRAGAICDECLGRLAARLGRGLSNARRGEMIRQQMAQYGVTSAPGACWICEDGFKRLASWAEQAAERAAAYEFSSYLFGVKLTSRLEQMEAFYVQRFPSDYRETLKHAMNRVLGIAFEQRLNRKITVDFKAPQLSFVLDLETEELSLHVSSLYYYGRYQKLKRGIPQTKWPCRACRGRGCARCGETGLQYPTSVETLIAAPLIEIAGAAGASLHGAGREDVDARMLGSGRPFVLELLAPKRRSVEVDRFQDLVNASANGRVHVSPMCGVRRLAVKWVKDLRATKRYRAEVEFGDEVSASQLHDALESLPGEIQQQTPQRVSHRRADLIRERTLHSIAGTWRDARHAEIDVHGDGGLYIKELISGDGGRTQPSVTAALGTQATVTALDVLDVCSGDVPESMAIADGLS